MTLARSLLCSSSLLALVAAAGCQVDKSLGDLDDDTTTSAPEPTTTAEDTGDPEPTTGDPPAACLQHETFSCDVPIDCAFERCDDGPLSEIDANGCLRPRCGNGTCPAGYTCVSLGAWGSCGASSWSCEPYEGECGCGGTADCSDAVSICVEDEVAPPAACPGLTDEASCLDAGCSAFQLAPRVEIDEIAGTCSCAAPEPACLWFPGGNVGGDDVSTPYVSFQGEEGGRVVQLLAASYDVTPLGWHECTDIFDAELCACAQALSCP